MHAPTVLNTLDKVAPQRGKYFRLRRKIGNKHQSFFSNSNSLASGSLSSRGTTETHHARLIVFKLKLKNNFNSRFLLEQKNIDFLRFPILIMLISAHYEYFNHSQDWGLYNYCVSDNILVIFHTHSWCSSMRLKILCQYF